MYAVNETIHFQVREYLCDDITPDFSSFNEVVIMPATEIGHFPKHLHTAKRWGGGGEGHCLD